ncbi:hypothetical protein ACWEQG_02040 [Microbispora sp. NPDC004025]
MTKVLGWIGALVLVAGLLVGFIPVSSSGVTCGSAFVESREAFVHDLTESMFNRVSSVAQACEDLRSLVRIPAIVLVVIAVILLFGAIVSHGRQEPTQEG